MWRLPFGERVLCDSPALSSFPRHRFEKPQRGVGSEPGDRQDWNRISGKMRRKSMPVLSVPGARVGGDEVSMAVFHEVSRAEGPSQQIRKTPRTHARVTAGSGPPSMR